MAALSHITDSLISNDRRSVNIAGLGTLYAKALTAHEIDAIMRRHPNFVDKPSMEATVDIIIRKCEVESGEAAFDIGDKPKLMRWPLDKLNQIRAGLFPSNDSSMSDEAIEEETKN